MYIAQLQALLRHPHYQTHTKAYLRSTLPSILTSMDMGDSLCALLLDLAGQSNEPALTLLLFDFLLEQPST